MADTKLIKGMNTAQKSIIEGKTPSEYIKEREGRGGRTFNYVEVGYVVKTLNEAFNFLWDFEVLEEKVGTKQVWVKGKLTVRPSPDLVIIKTAYGGSAIKKTKAYGDSAGGEIIDIADDLKAAASDALKKASSLLGVAGDVYYPNIK